ncbi:MAG: SAM-dependent methyltransferase [Lachnospiraceae bacterium]|nr:SAM-dependent methyltransferase [Lachnospiraceae bacterium]
MTLLELLDKCINENLKDIVISSPLKDSELKKVRVRVIKLSNDIAYQVTEYVGTKVIHTNYDAVSLKEKLVQYMQGFKQAQIETTSINATVLVSKKGTTTIKCKQKQQIEKAPLIQEHNRTKEYILKEGISVPFLVDLGIMTKEGKIVNSKYDKYRQINRFLEFIEDILPSLDSNKEQTIIDFGCGKSYLTFAMYYYLKELKNYDVRIIGLDLKRDVIEKCNELSASYGYEKLNFYVGDIASYSDVESVDMVVTLHACDTATDYALYKAVNWGAKVILSVPCCQHEANKTINNKDLAPVLKYGIIKERMSALITDAIRAQTLECKGYKTQILEFIDMEHTPKNIFIRAVKKEKMQAKVADVSKLQEMLNLDLTLCKLFKEQDNEECN